MTAAAVPARAWDEAGHRTIGAGAWLDLDAGTRARVGAFLARHFDFSPAMRTEAARAEVDYIEYLFMKASEWPDDIRSERHPSRFFHVGDWHFRGRTYAPDGPVPYRLSSPSQDALEILQTSMATVPRADASLPARTAALCWLFHLVGDAHQPLHGVRLVNEDFPYGDRGGNLFWVIDRPGRAPTNLHSLWDGLYSRDNRPDEADALARRLLAIHPRSSLPELRSHLKHSEWLAESYEASRNHSYGFTDATGKKWTLKPGIQVRRGEYRADRPPQPLPPGYLENARAVAGRRIAVACYRMADALRVLFPAP